LKNLRRAYLASLVCLAGGASQIIYGVLSIPFPYYDPNTYYGWDEVLWAVVGVGMIAGAFGLLALDVARPRWLAVIGAALSILGNLIRIVASALLIIAPSGADAYVPLILISIALLVLGMGALGAATLLGRQLHGWQSWTPLLAGGCALIIAPTYSINLFLHFILLGIWGIPWMLLGYVIFTHAVSPHQTVSGQVSSMVPEQGAGVTQHD
jgi:hypothetical protein